MNAIVENPIPERPERDVPHQRAAVAAPHSTHVFKLLLKREFWEHKGGFLWAPMVAGAIFLLLSLMGIGVGEMAAKNIPEHATVNVDGGSFKVAGLNLGQITDKMSPDELRELGSGLDIALVMASSWPFIVLAFVVFFYCLGSLYDDRKDRSVLFWKSLPLSDTSTVLSKVASATLVAPTLALIAAIATLFGFMLIISAITMLHGGNPATLLWGPASPLKIIALLALSLPVYAAWALPTVGWLLLCSSWARSKPFLWAIMIPLFAGIFVSWFDLMQAFNLESSWFWKHVVGRLLLSTVPGSDLLYRGENLQLGDDGLEHINQLLSLRTAYGAFALPEMWAGIVAGAAMVFGAIRLRRWRDEG
ncbi:hypothetical protein ACFQZQ_01990 [Lysobacter koreensis]|uniref:ABC transporter permease n=1 Tax=Lysobacter koreensis TaxID=266122 RepID=A0ABW2YIY4_9GAMM